MTLKTLATPMADQFYGLTDTGRERRSNEDAFIAQRTVNDRFVIACVIDGVGGYAGGEIAAALTREAIIKRLERPAGEVVPILVDCFNLANQSILAAKQEKKDHQHMACVATLALVDLERNLFHYVHVGDTRLYLLRDGSLVKITRDQSFVGFLEDSGRLNEQDAMAHPKRNEINKALGFERNSADEGDYFETGTSPFLPGDMLLLCSDGLTDMAAREEIINIIAKQDTLEQKAQDLITAANARGGRDNITVVLVENTKEAVKHQATKPTAAQKRNEPAVVAAEPVAVPVETVEQPVIVEAPKKRGGKWLTTLIALVLVAIAAIMYKVVSDRENLQPTVIKPAPQPVKPVLTLENKLQKTIDSLKGNLLILTDTAFQATIGLSKPIEITRDTLFIKTKGNITLMADSNYQGAAFNISPKTRLVMLDSMMITGFKTGIAGNTKPLLLKNIRFVNCAVPVQNETKVENNKYISGTLSALKADTVPVNAKRK